ncbi:hypothetical protein Psed_0162 [Pseudonocardia dioxanivorans CB1190]|uniref:DNA-binding transcriptional regulator of glucitol operon n=1 Tax=Pseudonocardia dioxanivorans (strain ATCC 55486 / DSM 44775 / JCM 13855 / CB1190) TaxID=675635 RepID=F4CIP1_PSEUX|nr:hypothetical protein [Pseudonocardia dioxanivorans]AEA22438.1 hypothetical protein Psed_0162 [Pseudonocardia dioxanivorans CB1190]
MLRLALTPRWMAWHVLTLGAMVACGFLSAWQWHRAGEAMGSALNIGYGVQWPVFAVFFGVMWWRFLRLEARRLAGTDVDEHAPVPTESGPVQQERTPAPAVPVVKDEGPSPFGVRRTAVPEPDDEENPQLAAYNRMLAELAERDDGR